MLSFWFRVLAGPPKVFVLCVREGPRVFPITLKAEIVNPLHDLPINYAGSRHLRLMEEMSC